MTLTLFIDKNLQREIDDITQNLSHLKTALAYEQVLSTNDCASTLEKDGASSGTIVIAGLQTSGRGRLKRTWLMQCGDIALSLIVRPPYVPKKLTLLSMMHALAVVDALKSLGVDAKLKWPNDVIVQTSLTELPYFGTFRKVAGILVENIFREHSIAASIIGIGINIVANARIKDEVSHALSLADINPRLTRALCLKALLEAIDQRLLAVCKSEHDAALIKEYESKCETLGRMVRVDLEGITLEGRAVRLNDDGTLVINDGEREHTVFAGDVRFLVR